METYYAVKRGRNTGVYFSWYECKDQIDGYPHPYFKKFNTYKEASDWLLGKEKEEKKKNIGECMNLYEANWEYPVCFYAGNDDFYVLLIIYKGEVTEIRKKYKKKDNKTKIVGIRDIERYCKQKKNPQYLLIHQKENIMKKFHYERDISTSPLKRFRISGDLIYDDQTSINPYHTYLNQKIN